MGDLRGKTVLVTGGTGFLGTHVCDQLHRKHANIVPLSSADGENFEYLIDKSRPEIVIHLAAMAGGIGLNRQHPALLWDTNLRLGMSVIEGCRAFKDKCVRKLIMVGSTCAYPERPKSIPFREEEIFDGFPERTNAAYGIAKRALLAGAWAYRQEFGLNVCTVVPTNLYGPRDNFDLQDSHVIPALIRKFLSTEGPVELWGTGDATRDFLYVEDCAEAIVRAAERLEDGNPINLGSGREVMISDLAEIIAKATGHSGAVIWDTTKPNGQPRRCLDTSRAKIQLGWQATTPLEVGIKKTIDWWRAHNYRYS